MNSDAFSEQQDLAKLIIIKFNQKSYGSWTKARDAYRSVSKNATVTSVWNMVYAERRRRQQAVPAQMQELQLKLPSK
jgi:hypothetical protein